MAPVILVLGPCSTETHMMISARLANEATIVLANGEPFENKLSLPMITEIPEITREEKPKPLPPWKGKDYRTRF